MFMHPWAQTLVFGVCLLTVSVGQTPQSSLVLRVKARQTMPDGSVGLTLQSGRQITVSLADVDEQMTQTVNSTATSAPAQTATASATALPPIASAAGVIRAKCTKDWPDDFQMRAFCEKQQTAALTTLHQRTMTSPDQLTIRNTCARDWHDDFQIRSVCEEKQLEALKKIGR
jgi:hypothetical protein